MDEYCRFFWKIRLNSKLTARGAAYVSLPGSNPLVGNSSANGASNLNSFPSALLSLSVSGLKSRRPAIDNAVTISGLEKPIKISVSIIKIITAKVNQIDRYLVTKQCVAGLASLRPVKLRLYEVTMVFLSPFLISLRSH